MEYIQVPVFIAPIMREKALVHAQLTEYVRSGLYGKFKDLARYAVQTQSSFATHFTAKLDLLVCRYCGNFYHKSLEAISAPLNNQLEVFSESFAGPVTN